MTASHPVPAPEGLALETTRRKIYVASSWRCADQPRIVALLRNAGHQVYDFRNPAPGNKGFAWSDIDPEWIGWEPAAFAKLLSHPIAQSGFALDKQALDWCDTCVLVLPCGRSAHLEAGYAAGQGKDTLFYLSPDKFEPELMYLLGNGCVTTDADLLARLSSELSRLREPAGEEVEALIARLIRSIQTASNDDYSEVGTDKRVRHVERLAAMADARDALRRLSQSAAEERGRIAAWLDDADGKTLERDPQDGPYRVIFDPVQLRALARAIERLDHQKKDRAGC